MVCEGFSFLAYHHKPLLNDEDIVEHRRSPEIEGVVYQIEETLPKAHPNLNVDLGKKGQTVWN